MSLKMLIISDGLYCCTVIFAGIVYLLRCGNYTKSADFLLVFAVNNPGDNQDESQQSQGIDFVGKQCEDEEKDGNGSENENDAGHAFAIKENNEG